MVESLVLPRSEVNIIYFHFSITTEYNDTNKAYHNKGAPICTEDKNRSQNEGTNLFIILFNLIVAPFFADFPDCVRY